MPGEYQFPKGEEETSLDTSHDKMPNATPFTQLLDALRKSGKIPIADHKKAPSSVQEALQQSQRESTSTDDYGQGEVVEGKRATAKPRPQPIPGASPRPDAPPVVVGNQEQQHFAQMLGVPVEDVLDPVRLQKHIKDQFGPAAARELWSAIQQTSGPAPREPRDSQVMVDPDQRYAQALRERRDVRLEGGPLSFRTGSGTPEGMAGAPQDPNVVQFGQKAGEVGSAAKAAIGKGAAVGGQALGLDPTQAETVGDAAGGAVELGTGMPTKEGEPEANAIQTGLMALPLVGGLFSRLGGKAKEAKDAATGLIKKGGGASTAGDIRQGPTGPEVMNAQGIWEAAPKVVSSKDIPDAAVKQGIDDVASVYQRLEQGKAERQAFYTQASREERAFTRIQGMTKTDSLAYLKAINPRLDGVSDDKVEALLQEVSYQMTKMKELADVGDDQSLLQQIALVGELLQPSEEAAGGASAALRTFADPNAVASIHQAKVAELRQWFPAAVTSLQDHGVAGLDAIRNAVKNMPDDKARTEMVRQVNDKLNKARTGKLQVQSYWDLLLEPYINGLLSNPVTHARNIVGNSVAFATTQTESLIANVIGSAYRDVPKGETWARTVGIAEGFMDGMRVSWRSWKTGKPESIGTSKLSELGLQPAYTAERFGLTGGAGKAVDYMGTALRIPGRLMLAEDQFFNAMAYRTELRVQANRKAWDYVNAHNLTGDEATRAYSATRDSILEFPELYPDVHNKAADYSSYVTFTKELTGVGRDIQKTVNNHPWLRFMGLQFIRTPGNLGKFAGERTPLALLSGRIREDIAAGGERRDVALARMSFATSMASALVFLSSNDTVTGSGPADPKLRGQLKDNGWRPDSIKIWGRRYDYDVTTPTGAILKMAADTSAVLAQMKDDTEAENVGQAFMLSIMHILEPEMKDVRGQALYGAQQSARALLFVNSIGETLDIINSAPEGQLENWLGRQEGTLLPLWVKLPGAAEGTATKFPVPLVMSGFAKQTGKWIDPYMKDAQNIQERAMSMVPIFSKDVPNQVDPITGQDRKYPGIFSTDATQDPVKTEINAQRIHISDVPNNAYGVYLDGHAIHELSVDAATGVKVHGKNLHDTLETVMRKPVYQNARGYHPNEPEHLNMKAKIVHDTIDAFRQEAVARLVKRNPGVKAAVRDLLKTRYNPDTHENYSAARQLHSIGILGQ